MDFKQLFTTDSECVDTLHTNKVFLELWSDCAEQVEAPDCRRGKRKCAVNWHFEVCHWAGMRNTGKPEDHRGRRYSCDDALSGEMAWCFGQKNTVFMESIALLAPEKMKPLLRLRLLIASSMSPVSPFWNTWTVPHLQMLGNGHWEHCSVDLHRVLEAMASVLTAFQIALTFGPSTAVCGNSFFYSEKCVHWALKKHVPSSESSLNPSY